MCFQETKTNKKNLKWTTSTNKTSKQKGSQEKSKAQRNIIQTLLKNQDRINSNKKYQRITKKSNRSRKEHAEQTYKKQHAQPKTKATTI